MRECYHEPCDYPLNPGVKPDSLYFLAKATQALVLTLVELTGGRDSCDRDVFAFDETHSEAEEDQGPNSIENNSCLNFVF